MSNALVSLVDTGDDIAMKSADSTGTEDAASERAWGLVHAAQQGDTAAFGMLYDQYVDTVYRYVLFRVGDKELAEDVTSETFLRALRRITSVSYQGRDVGAWFVTIARNLILDHVKSSRYRREIATGEIADAGSVPFLAEKQADTGPEQQVIAMATKDELFRCIQELGDDQQECIVLRFLQGLSVAETAEIMDRNEGAIKALQHRAVRRLAQLMPNGLR
ncbi:sigma-70 family RNA polymerase sigma factor [Haloechinothrix salitolerans]